MKIKLIHEIDEWWQRLYATRYMNDDNVCMAQVRKKRLIIIPMMKTSNQKEKKQKEVLKKKEVCKNKARIFPLDIVQ